MNSTKKGRRRGKKIKKIIISLIYIALLIFVIEFFGTKGIWGLIIMTVLFGLWRLYVRREQFIWILRYIETIIYGKPLDRELWDKGEFKNRKKRKIKICWKKKEVDNHVEEKAQG